jgi:hypothetical protein
MGSCTRARAYQFSGTEGALDEDDDLVELKLIKQLVQLTVLLLLVKLDVVLLKP